MASICRRPERIETNVARGHDIRARSELLGKEARAVKSDVTENEQPPGTARTTLTFVRWIHCISRGYAMLITLTTDFGYADPYVGIMKGVISRIDPQARMVDLSHGVPAQDIMAAALLLRHSLQYFPRGTIHIAVVDPGVGSARRPLLVEADGNYFIGPDNGVLSLAITRGGRPSRIIHLSNTIYYLRPTSATFHGRDIFAPVAAYLSLGIAPEAFGETINDCVELHWPTILRTETTIEGQIVYIDGFGNLFTNIGADDLEKLSRRPLRITVRDLTILGLADNYAAVEPGKYVTLINSWGLLEIAIYKESAKRRSGAIVGDKVEVAPVL
jgi:S-adenosyl-L-methionine hydrolase (adenosine-forming)